MPWEITGNYWKLLSGITPINKWVTRQGYIVVLIMSYVLCTYGNDNARIGDIILKCDIQSKRYVLNIILHQLK